MNRQTWPALLLIAVGIILLLDQMDLVYFSQRDIFTYGFIAIGVVLLINAFGRPDRKGILGGTFFLSYGLILTAMRSNVFLRDDEFGVATFFLALALGNLVYFLFKTERWGNFAWGIVFGLFGGAMLLSYYNYYPSWLIYDQIDRYWPVALIVIGASIVIKGMRRKSNVAAHHQTN